MAETQQHFSIDLFVIVFSFLPAQFVLRNCTLLSKSLHQLIINCGHTIFYKITISKHVPLSVLQCPSVQHFRYIFIKKFPQQNSFADLFQAAAQNVEIVRFYQTQHDFSYRVAIPLPKLKVVYTDTDSKENAQIIASNNACPVVDYRLEMFCYSTQDFRILSSSITRVNCCEVAVHQELFPSFMVAKHLTKLRVHGGFQTPKRLVFDLNMLRTTKMEHLRHLSLSCVVADSNPSDKQLIQLPKLKLLLIYKCHIADSVPIFPLDTIPHLQTLRLIWTVLSKESIMHLLSRGNPKIVDLHFDFAAMQPTGHYPAKLNNKLVRGPLETVHPAFSFSSLIALNFSGCFISKLPLKLLQIPTLQQLFLSSNSITELPAIPKNTIVGNSLLILKLDRNEIKALPSKTYFEAFRGLQLLDLRANPLVHTFRKMKTNDNVAEGVPKSAILGSIRTMLQRWYWKYQFSKLNLDYYQRLNDTFFSAGAYLDGAFSGTFTIHKSMDTSKHTPIYEITMFGSPSTKHRCASFLVEPPDTPVQGGNVVCLAMLCCSEQYATIE